MLSFVIPALVLVAFCVAVPLTRRNTRLDDVDRFAAARSITNTWASSPQGNVRVPAQGDDDTD